MGNAFKILSLILFSITLVLGTGERVVAAKKDIKITAEENALLDKWEAKKNEKSRKKSVKKLRKALKKPMAFVGSAKCNGSCHDPYYEAWLVSPHGGTFNLLKPGERKEAKERVKLDPEKDYTTTPLCLRCHTTGYAQRGGFKPAGSKNKTGKDIATKIDPDEPSLEHVGCEMCHSVAGGSHFRAIMTASKGKFDKGDVEKYGQRWDYANVCTRCHTHRQTPFQPDMHEKYKFNFEERKKKVHEFDKFWNDDNKDQKLEKIKERVKEVSQSEKTPLVIEDFADKDGRLRFKKGAMPYNYKEKTFNYKK